MVQSPTLPSTKTTCPYCGVGCGVLVAPATNGSTALVKGDPDHPANFGRLCTKGLALGETIDMEERLLFPEIDGIRTNWDTALDKVADGFRRTIEEHGPDSVAFYVSGQILTEDYYVANKLMKGFIGSSNIDTNSRLCMASSVVGHKRAFGTDTVPGCYEDLELADLIIMVGSNFAWCHPVLFQRVLAAQEARGTRIIVIDPRKTSTAEIADLHLPIAPGSDVALFNWLFSELAKSDARDRAFVEKHTRGFESALETASALSIETMSEITDLRLSDLQTLRDWVCTIEKTMTIYSQGVNQSSSGSDKVSSILNTHLVTGRVGKPGMGPFSITGQPNAMGGREVGGLANQLAAHMDFAPEDIDRVSRFWNAPNISRSAGSKAIDMFDAVYDGRIKAIWIMATNPVVSMPQADKVKEALARCPLVVVSDVVTTSDTVKLANVSLPATAWGEKSGTVTNSERRISRQRSFLEPPGESKHDWWALCQVARRMGYEGFGFESASEIYREHAALSGFENTNTRDFDISADAEISNEDYAAMVPYQWPKPVHRDIPGSVKGNSHRFFENGRFYTEDRKARFVATPFKPPQERPDDELPFILNTGRARDHWHTMTRTGKSAKLSTHIGEPYLEIHPKDAQRLGIPEASIVKIRNHNGAAVLRAKLTRDVRQGEIFAPMHWTDRYSSAGRICALVGDAQDPSSGQQESKCIPAAIELLKPQNFILAVTQKEPNIEFLNMFQYWALARIKDGWRLEAAGDKSAKVVSESWSEHGPHAETTSSRTGARYAWFEKANLQSLLIVSAGAPVAADRVWVDGLLGREVVGQERIRVLAGRPPAGEIVGPLVCMCESVPLATIDAAIKDGASTISEIGKCTRAGTNCGSCKPDLLARIRELDAVSDPQMEFAE